MGVRVAARAGGPMVTTRDPFGLVGTTLDERYRVDAVVGEGGFGVVYRGVHLAFDAPIAVKVLKIPAQMSADERATFLATFRAEGKLLFELSRLHTAFVRAIETGVATTSAGATAPYLVLEWLDGSTLDHDLDQRRSSGGAGRPLGEVIELLDPIAEALAVAHERDVAHRDVKPANVFLARTPRGVSAKLLDLGIAKVMSEGSGTAAIGALTVGGFGAFTPNYSAPEQWLRKLGATGPWTDVYAFALLCVELLTDRPALRGDEPGQFMGATTDRDDRPTPSARGALVVAAVEDVFARALAIDPHDRYRNLRAFWEALRTAAKLEPHTSLHAGPEAAMAPTVARPWAIDPPLFAVASAPAPAPAPTTQPPKVSATTSNAVVTIPPAPPRAPASGRGRAVVVGAVLGGVVMAVAAVGGLWRSFARGGATDGATPASASGSASALALPVGPSGCPDGMVAIAGATFEMGDRSGVGDADERPAHAATVASFCLDAIEVSADAYRACVTAGACAAATGEVAGRPVAGVDWHSATRFCASVGKRLPSEAEWELAARGTEGRAFPWGREPPTCEHANVASVRGQACPHTLAPARSHAAGNTPAGVADLAGSVWEWVADVHAPYGAAPPSPAKGSEDARARVLRGGSFTQDLALARPTNRLALAPAEHMSDVGLRCAWSDDATR